MDNPDNTSAIENEINLTVLFPDKDSVNEQTGGFATTEAFRDFLCSRTNQRTEHIFFTRPTKDRKQDYLQDEFIMSLPLQFPFGFGGLNKQNCLASFTKKSKKRLDYKETLQMFLRHRRKEFHSADFNLFVNDRIMKQVIFANARLQCNLKFADAKSMGEKYGSLTSDTLKTAIEQARSASSAYQGYNSTGNAFLRSVNAACNNLPHTNEASSDAKQKYFANIVRFGLPALFITISPDDQRSLWISVYAAKNTEKFWSTEPTTSEYSDENLIGQFKQRCRNRLELPGLCAESYMAIVECFIKYVLQWDIEKNVNTGEGYFGFVEAFTKATEEQGRKSLHGHFLVWIKGWNCLLQRIMDPSSPSPIQRQQDLTLLKKYVSHCSSSSIFDEFKPGRCFAEHSAFYHKDCRSTRKHTVSRYTVTPVSERQLAEMRHKCFCHLHHGHIADCQKCNRKMTIHEVVTNALNHIDTIVDNKYKYPDDAKRLDRLVYEMEKDFDWFIGPPKKMARRIFAANALSNIHYTLHSTRCFKSSPSCYASLPRNPSEISIVAFSEELSKWPNWHGFPHQKRIFEVRLARNTEDVYTNTHNPDLSAMFLCNNNVAAAMTGASVMYCTAYNTKKTQKEEKQAYEDLAKTLLQVIEKQVR